MTVQELQKKYDNKEHPDDIFFINEEFLKLSVPEQEEFCKAYGRDEVAMQYITAVEMKNKGTWEAYVKRWEQNKHKSSEDKLREYMNERGLTFPGKVEAEV